MIVPVIFLSLLGIFFILYLIGYFKRINVLQKVSLPFILPCAVGVTIPILLSKMPDSFHIIVFSSIAFFFVLLQIWIEPLNLKKKLTFIHILFIISNIVWIVLFYSIFYLYNYSVSITVLTLVIYVASIIFCSINFAIKSLRQILNLLIIVCVCFFLNFISVVSLVHSRELYSILLFIGTILLIGYTFTSLSTRFKSLIKHSVIVLNLLFVGGELCIYAASVLMLF